jgi:NAD(P)-dependent dehydrogenase (short-subunit alcohol dehydrogenase family)
MDLVNDYDFDGQALYAMSKTAMNMITAKFNAQYKKDGVLFLSICPGMVEAGHFDGCMFPSLLSPCFLVRQLTLTLHIVTPEQTSAAQVLLGKFKEYAPHFQGPDTPHESVKAVMSVVNKCSVEAGDGGAFLSHLGNKQWV